MWGKLALFPIPLSHPVPLLGGSNVTSSLCRSRSILWFYKQIHTCTHTFIFPCSFLCKWQHTTHLILSLAVVCLTIYTYHPFPCFCSYTVFQVWAFINNQTLVLYVHALPSMIINITAMNKLTHTSLHLCIRAPGRQSLEKNGCIKKLGSF